MTQNKSCTIAIAVWNNKDLTRQCLTSLVSNTDEPYQVLIIDNGSGENTKTFLEDFCRNKQNFHLKRFDENKGYVTAANYALSTFNTPYLCLLNNDTILTENWLSECICVLETRHDAGIISPTTNEISRKFERRYKTGRMKRYRGKSVEVNACVGSCFIVKKTVVDAVGLFDTAYAKGYFEEVDFCLRAQQKGFHSVLALGAYIHHFSGSTFKEMLEKERLILWHKNRDILISRWGKEKRILFFVRRNYYGNSLAKAREYLLKECRDRAIIDFYFRKNRRWISDTHFNIRPKDCIFYNLLTMMIIMRFKKKSYDAVITDIKIPSFLLKNTKTSIIDFKLIG